MKKLATCAALFLSATSPAFADQSVCDPYKDYSCFDSSLGDSFFTRLFNYYSLEMGHAGAPSDPNAASTHREAWPATPQSNPPMPFTEWPYGATTSLGVSTPNAVDSPLMVALADTSSGKFLSDNHIQIYGWVEPGFNVSTNTERRGGNAPMAYTYSPDTAQLDQSVIYIERVPDTVQTDHIDWGFRLSGLYGVDYRYTTALGISSNQLLTQNHIDGYDFPMEYGELYLPQVSDGLLLRFGRYISIPDIEAQLAPNNYMYTHSMTYTFDNYTNEGMVGSLAVTKNFLLQLGIVDGTETALWNAGKSEPNLVPNNALYPGQNFKKDPGNQPTAVACARYTWNNGDDTIYPCMDGINSGEWGYNNLQWYGTTFYHKFNDQWHLSYEVYDLHQRDVPNANNATAYSIFENGGTPFSPPYITKNAPDLAQCGAGHLTCTATAIGTVAYLNYQFSPLDNISFRPEFYDDENGQRTGVVARYANFGIGWQHWLSPQIELRPEIDYDHSIGVYAFNANPTRGIAPDRNYTVLGAMDAIIHF